MTIERAMEILDPKHREHYDSIDVVNEACRMGMEALEKQIPKKPLYIAGDYDLPLCSKCKSPAEDNEPYCSVCGQAIDWSDAE